MNTAAVVNAYRRMEQAVGFSLWGGPVKAERHFTEEEDACTFRLGCAGYNDREALAYLVEASRFLNAGELQHAATFTRMALDAMERRAR